MKTILITGGTGFLGRNLALKLKNEYRVILTGRNNKQNLFASKYTGCQVAPLDITNIESVRDVFVEFKPDIVIHAAATKFVDLAEKYPMECVDVNVLGSQNVARVAVEREITTVVGISTDKAAPPVRNIYGMSKSIMERIFCAMDGKTSTKFTAVRYGNVAWSTGSVLPIWKKMHEETGIIGTTGPEMRRFFFSVDEAVQLVITAMDNIDLVKGKVLSRYMKAAQIEDILQTWIEERGGKWEKIEGRPGEREDEFLIGDLELPYTEELQLGGIKHYLISFNNKVVNPIPFGLSSANTDRLSREEILSIINNPPIEER
ncbi:polysaccharide biosynthesis protein [Algoriphagus boritolerans]|uniref:UDP-glucose 4-epimerase n=1 Tax=Algoriphagus boritolerans DSM 17298 = JCM 18970 TaxID=1120964 RepID=A0A1H5RX83_9BACT|nr:polysaccharide biosynthesis protein [Algoriphagus boritolerans]SEF42298.1 UDP-glucose 4-epimerase [Algoriphagus boritolerans DSM 17298 = JCM 18970]